MIEQNKAYVFDWDKIKTTKDVIRVLRMMGMVVKPKTEEECIIWNLVEDLLVEIEE